MDQAPKNERYTEYPSENDLRLSFENFLSVLPLPIFKKTLLAQALSFYHQTFLLIYRTLS